MIVRNTMPQLKDTTIASWNYWFRDGEAGTWKETEKKFTLRFGDIECEVLFRALDTPDDVQRVLSLEINFAIVDEFVQIPYQIIEALSGRLGRYKRPDGSKPSVYGMWGASNPDTEDNWWHDYLHRSCADPDRNMPADEVARYFKQPSGFSDEAENLDNLPNNYYLNLQKGKSQAWVKQFIEGEWGFSIAGQRVVPSFFREQHASNKPKYNPNLRLVVGFDPGLGGSSFVFMQEDMSGHLNVLGELNQAGVGTQRLIDEHLKPYLAQNFPRAKVLISVDPAAQNRSSNDENTIVRTLRRHFDIWTESNNRLPLRLDAIEYFTNRMICGKPALQVDADACPVLTRALLGGWRYEVDTKKDEIKNAQPEKNRYSHTGDAFGYGARYFHKKAEKEIRYAERGVKPFVPPRTFGSGYHAR